MKSRIASILAALLWASMVCCSAALAQIPKTINYQGYLTSPSGAAINNPSVSMVFKLYDAVTGGTLLHTETQPTVTVSNGIFNVVLGTNATLTASFAGPYWLGVKVGTDAEMTPRQPLTSSPYAITAQNIAPGGNIVLTTPSTATVGNIMKGGNSFIHNYGPSNTFVGLNAGNFATAATNTVGVGENVLQLNTTGIQNTAVGAQALASNTTGGDNAAFGAGALFSNVTGNANTALGIQALLNSGKTVTAGAFVTGVGYTIQSVGTTNFTAIGASSNAVGTVFTATGAGSGTGTAASNTGFNTAIGYAALYGNTTGVNNIAIGGGAGNTIGAAGSNNIVIGNGGVAGDNSTIRLGDPAVHTKTILAGNVGIGTANPTKALVEINGFANNTLLGTVGLFSPSGAGSQIPQQTLAYSLYASNLVAGNSFVAFSDQRIKRMTGRSDTAKDLTTLAAIEITDYAYIDSVNHGNKPHKKVIAQQVEKVYPQAVSQMTDVVPDIYLKADIKDGWIKLATNLKKGERVRLIGKTANGVFEVLDVAANRFRTDFKADADTVFVYGREVKDFRSVDYEAIAMLNVSATQELNRRVERQDAKIAQLEQQLAMLAQLQAQVAEIAKANTTQVAYRPASN